MIADRQQLWSPELQKETEERWTSLLQDIEAAAERGIAPESAAAQELLARINQLVEAFTGGHSAIGEGLAKLWSDQANWPEEFKETVFSPFADRGVAAAQRPAPRLLSERRRPLWKPFVRLVDVSSYAPAPNREGAGRHEGETFRG